MILFPLSDTWHLKSEVSFLCLNIKSIAEVMKAEPFKKSVKKATERALCFQMCEKIKSSKGVAKFCSKSKMLHDLTSHF